MINVVVANPFPLVQKGIESSFASSKDINIVKAVYNDEDLYSVLDTHDVDIVLLELDLPTTNGFQVLKKLKKEYTKVKPIILTSHSEEIYSLSTLKSGAFDFLEYDVNPNILEQTIKYVYTKKRIILDTSKSKGLLHKKLSSRELEVLKLLSAGKRNIEVAEELDINEKTVSTYKMRLLKKFEVTNLVDLLNKVKNLKVD